jgi:ring-1,2-phenylacetyl-CoA epoxidase subunit PaaC
VLRLGDGTAESHRRAQDAVDALWPLTADLCSATDVELRLTECGVGVDPREVAGELRAVLTQVLEQATLRVPPWPEPAPPRGRLGEHDPAVAELVGTLQSLARRHPAATW